MEIKKATAAGGREGSVELNSCPVLLQSSCCLFLEPEPLSLAEVEYASCNIDQSPQMSYTVH